MKFLALGMIKLYKNTLSKVLPPACRFYPSCSMYTYQAIEKYGVFKGSWLGFKRILRCQPFYKGDPYDPVP
ncbi:MAG: membrane protein insertion efficiency factor YidD [Anaerolineae bacterium]